MLPPYEHEPMETVTMKVFMERSELTPILLDRLRLRKLHHRHAAHSGSSAASSSGGP